MASLVDIFEDLSSFAYNVNKDVEVKNYPIITHTDFEPVSIVSPSENGPWIAGGAVLRWYQGLPVRESDIDVFCANKEQAQKVIDEVRSYGRYSNKFTSENATTLDYWSKNSTLYGVESWTIQVITKRFYSNMQEIIDNFDISVCQLATDGKTLVMGKNTAKDIREKNLRMSIPLQPDALKRLTKYWIYGYRPVPGLLDAVKNNPIARWEFSPEEDYK